MWQSQDIAKVATELLKENQELIKKWEIDRTYTTNSIIKVIESVKDKTPQEIDLEKRNELVEMCLVFWAWMWVVIWIVIVVLFA